MSRPTSARDAHAIRRHRGLQPVHDAPGAFEIARCCYAAEVSQKRSQSKKPIRQTLGPSRPSLLRQRPAVPELSASERTSLAKAQRPQSARSPALTGVIRPASAASLRRRPPGLKLTVSHQRPDWAERQQPIEIGSNQLSSADLPIRTSDQSSDPSLEDVYMTLQAAMAGLPKTFPCAGTCDGMDHFFAETPAESSARKEPFFEFEAQRHKQDQDAENESPHRETHQSTFGKKHLIEVLETDRGLLLLDRSLGTERDHSKIDPKEFLAGETSQSPKGMAHLKHQLQEIPTCEDSAQDSTMHQFHCEVREDNSRHVEASDGMTLAHEVIAAMEEKTFCSEAHVEKAKAKTEMSQFAGTIAELLLKHQAETNEEVRHCESKVESAKNEMAELAESIAALALEQKEYTRQVAVAAEGEARCIDRLVEVSEEETCAQMYTHLDACLAHVARLTSERAVSSTMVPEMVPEMLCFAHSEDVASSGIQCAPVLHSKSIQWDSDAVEILRDVANSGIQCAPVCGSKAIQCDPEEVLVVVSSGIQCAPVLVAKAIQCDSDEIGFLRAVASPDIQGAPMLGSKSIQCDSDEVRCALQETALLIMNDCPKECQAVLVSLTIDGLDYNELASDDLLLNSFRKKVKDSIAAEAGYGLTAEHIAIELSSGSVKVDARVLHPSADMSRVQSSLTGSSQLSSNVVEAVKRIPGIETVSTGTISVRTLYVRNQEENAKEKYDVVEDAIFCQFESSRASLSSIPTSFEQAGAKHTLEQERRSDEMGSEHSRRSIDNLAQSLADVACDTFQSESNEECMSASKESDELVLEGLNVQLISQNSVNEALHRCEASPVSEVMPIGNEQSGDPESHPRCSIDDFAQCLVGVACETFQPISSEECKSASNESDEVFREVQLLSQTSVNEVLHRYEASSVSEVISIASEQSAGNPESHPRRSINDFAQCLVDVACETFQSGGSEECKSASREFDEAVLESRNDELLSQTSANEVLLKYDVSSVSEVISIASEQLPANPESQVTSDNGRFQSAELESSPPLDGSTKDQDDRENCLDLDNDSASDHRRHSSSPRPLSLSAVGRNATICAPRKASGDTEASSGKSLLTITACSQSHAGEIAASCIRTTLDATIEGLLELTASDAPNVVHRNSGNKSSSNITACHPIRDALETGPSDLKTKVKTLELSNSRSGANEDNELSSILCESSVLAFSKRDDSDDDGCDVDTTDKSESLLTKQDKSFYRKSEGSSFGMTVDTAGQTVVTSSFEKSFLSARRGLEGEPILRRGSKDIDNAPSERFNTIEQDLNCDASRDEPQGRTSLEEPTYSQGNVKAAEFHSLQSAGDTGEIHHYRTESHTSLRTVSVTDSDSVVRTFVQHTTEASFAGSNNENDNYKHLDFRHKEPIDVCPQMSESIKRINVDAANIQDILQNVGYQHHSVIPSNAKTFDARPSSISSGSVGTLGSLGSVVARDIVQRDVSKVLAIGVDAQLENHYLPVFPKNTCSSSATSGSVGTISDSGTGVVRDIVKCDVSKVLANGIDAQSDNHHLPVLPSNETTFNTCPSMYSSGSDVARGIVKCDVSKSLAIGMDAQSDNHHLPVLPDDEITFNTCPSRVTRKSAGTQESSGSEFARDIVQCEVPKVLAIGVDAQLDNQYLPVFPNNACSSSVTSGSVGTISDSGTEVARDIVKCDVSKVLAIGIDAQSDSQHGTVVSSGSDVARNIVQCDVSKVLAIGVDAQLENQYLPVFPHNACPRSVTTSGSVGTISDSGTEVVRDIVKCDVLKVLAVGEEAQSDSQHLQVLPNNRETFNAYPGSKTSRGARAMYSSGNDAALGIVKCDASKAAPIGMDAQFDSQHRQVFPNSGGASIACPGRATTAGVAARNSSGSVVSRGIVKCDESTVLANGVDPDIANRVISGNGDDSVSVRLSKLLSRYQEVPSKLSIAEAGRNKSHRENQNVASVAQPIRPLKTDKEDMCSTSGVVEKKQGAPSISFSMRIKNIDYDLLIKNDELVEAFKKGMQETVAQESGIGIFPESVQVHLSSGSVIVHVTILPPERIDIDEACASLKWSASLSYGVVRCVNSLPNIAGVSYGTIRVSDITSPKVTLLPERFSLDSYLGSKTVSLPSNQDEPGKHYAGQTKPGFVETIRNTISAGADTIDAISGTGTGAVASDDSLTNIEAELASMNKRNEEFRAVASDDPRSPFANIEAQLARMNMRNEELRQQMRRRSSIQTGAQLVF